MVISLKRRARSDTDKQARREHLLTTALALWQERNFATLTMSEVATRAGLAKGTTYLYFQTKEELLLALLAQELEGWFNELDTHLEHTANLSGAQIAQAVAHSLNTRSTLKRLLTIQASILEHNISEDAAIDFKRFLLGRAIKTGSLLELRLPYLRQGEGVLVLQRINAMVVGFGQLSDPSDMIATILKRDEMAPMRVDFQTQLAQTLQAMLAGLELERKTT